MELNKMENNIELKGKYKEDGTYEFAMIKKFYSVYDKTGKCYMGNFEAETDMRAIRFIEDTVNNAQSPMAKHPEDYRLDKIFEMDMRKGKITDNIIRTIIEVEELKK